MFKKQFNSRQMKPRARHRVDATTRQIKLPVFGFISTVGIPQIFANTRTGFKLQVILVFIFSDGCTAITDFSAVILAFPQLTDGSRTILAYLIYYRSS